MKNYNTFINESTHVYRSNNRYTICDVDSCSKSDRTFDIKFSDFCKNEKLLNIFNLYFLNDMNKMSNYMSRNIHEVAKLQKNPTIRLLVVDPDLLISVLHILKPNDIRVAEHKYNL